MCEIPSNVILAEEFAKIFDGFSIGSNDLTQLTLGVDRDSSLVSHVYDEKNKAITTLIKNVIKIAHKHHRKIGICGQAPSDYPEFAEFLVREGIDSISLNPDTVVSTREKIAYMEKTLGKKGKKTSGKFLGLVALIGVMGATLITLGGGCSSIMGLGDKTEYKEVSPAEVREKVEQNKDKEYQEQMFTLKESSFADFTLQYPFGWSVENWNGGVTLRDSETEEYISIFAQLVGHPVSKKEKTEVTLDGKPGWRFADKQLGSEEEMYVIEIEVDGQTIEINGQGEDFDKIISTLQFVKDKGMPDKSLSHWDVREGRICVQMITYAKKSQNSKCEMFPTPCDVPDNWKVCDEGDI